MTDRPDRGARGGGEEWQKLRSGVGFDPAAGGGRTSRRGRSQYGSGSEGISAVGLCCLAIALGAPAGASAVGELAQKAGTAGCTSDDGVDVEDDLPGACVDANGVHTMVGPGGLAVSPDGANVYQSATVSSSLLIFDRGATGEVTQKAGTAGCVSDTGSSGACQEGALVNPGDAAVSPDGENVYVTSLDAIAVFDRDTSTGALTQQSGGAGYVSCGDVGCEPLSVVVSPDGKSVYATSFGNLPGHVSAILIFDRDPSTGALTLKPGTAGCVSDDGSGGVCIDGWLSTAPGMWRSRPTAPTSTWARGARTQSRSSIAIPRPAP